MDRKTLIAVGLSIIVIVGSLLIQTFLFPSREDRSYDTPRFVDSTVEAKGDVVLNDRNSRKELITSSVTAFGDDSPAGDRLIIKETGLFSLSFTAAGGDLTSIRLKQHHDVDGSDVELVLQPGNHHLFTIMFGGFGTKPIDSIFYFQELDDYTWSFSRDFLSQEGIPFTLTKTYIFKPNSYVFDLEIQIENSVNELIDLDFRGTAYTLGISPTIGPQYEALDNRIEYRNFRNFVGGKAKNQRIRGNEVLSEAKHVSWVAIVGKYFGIIAEPGPLYANKDSSRAYYMITYDQRKDPELIHRSALFFGRPTIQSAKSKDTFRFYIGPLKREILSLYNKPEADPFGRGQYNFQEAARTNPIIGWLANILRFFLDFFYSLVPNYGVAIILLTLLVKIVFFPLTHKSFESTSKMSMLSPKIEEIKKKHKGRPDKLNQEMMALYRKEGVNPLSGCLPLLLQMPIFFALFELLSNAFDLRGAPFIPPWIGDLSAPEKFLPLNFTVPMAGWDELRILPFVMLGTTLLQSRISQNPSANQAQMKLMMYAMPIFFFFILYNMPSGLVIYWTVQNILSVAQQLFINDRRRRRAGPDGTLPAGRGPSRKPK